MSSELNISIYGFHLLKSKDNKYSLIDLNDFPGFKGVKNREKIITDYILKFLNNI